MFADSRRPNKSQLCVPASQMTTCVADGLQLGKQESRAVARKLQSDVAIILMRWSENA